jgi:predicted dehydrogenase
MNIAVIGAGRWGPNYVRVFGGLEDCRVAAVADTDPKGRQRLGHQYEEIEFVSDYRALLRRPDVDAVAVATPTASHYAIVKDAIEAGKHVLCEKPVTHASREAWALGALAEEQKVTLMVGHVFLFNPGIDYLARAVHEATTGPIYYLSAVRTNLGPFRSDVDAAWTLHRTISTSSITCSAAGRAGRRPRAGRT